MIPSYEIFNNYGLTVISIEPDNTLSEIEMYGNIHSVAVFNSHQSFNVTFAGSHEKFIEFSNMQIDLKLCQAIRTSDHVAVQDLLNKLKVLLKLVDEK